MQEKCSGVIIWAILFFVLIWVGGTQPLCGSFHSEALWVAVPGFFMGCVIFLFSGKSFSAASLLTWDWFFSFVALVLLTCLLAVSLRGVFWDAYDLFFEGGRVWG